jgi:hypothetical protein
MFQNPELIVNKEFDDLLFTDTDCTPLFTPVLYRKLRRDILGNQIRCTGCNARASGIIEGDPSCPYCDGIGYLWDESIINGWIYANDALRPGLGHLPQPLGETDFNAYTIATRADLLLYNEDYIRTFNLSSDGTISLPITFRGSFKIYNTTQYASNQRNSEFNLAKLGLTTELDRYDNLTY